MNTEIVGSSSIMFVDGAVGPTVSRLTLVIESDLDGVDLPLVEADDNSPLRYFGYAIPPDEAMDRLAHDDAGRQVYSGGEKIRETRDGARQSYVG